MSDTRIDRTPAELKATGQNLHGLMHAASSVPYGLDSYPEILAAMASCSQDRNLTSLGTALSHLNDAIGVVVTTFMNHRVSNLLAMHESLKNNGHDLSNWLRVGSNGRYICALRDEPGLPEKEHELTTDADALAEQLVSELHEEANASYPQMAVKAMAYKNQNSKYIIILNQLYGRWSVHIRQYWDTLPLMTDKHAYLGTHLNAFRNSGSLTIPEAVALQTELANFANDVNPVCQVTQPSLESYLRGNLKAKTKASSIGLLYADGRDPGYILSTKCFNPDEHPEPVPNLSWNGIAQVQHVLDELQSAGWSVDESYPPK